ncbi:MAG: type II secretion system protein GspK [Geminicoccaceae bacterium]
MPPASEHRRRPWPKDRGAALLVAMLFVAVASGLALQLMTMWHSDTVAVRGQLDAVQSRAILQAAMADAVAVAVTHPGARPFPPVFTFDYGNARVRVVAASESGKVNLNGAKPELIDALIKVLGFSQDMGRTVGGAVVDWRDDDHERSATGAEDRDYENDNLPFGAADRPFANPRELAYVDGATSTVAQALAPYVTVYSGAADPVQLEAAAPVRQALAAVKKTTPQDEKKDEGSATGSQQSGSAYGNEGTRSSPEVTGPQTGAAPAGAEQTGGSAGAAAPGAPDGARTYTLWLDARLANGYVARARAVVWLHAGPGGAIYRVLDWAPYVMPGEAPA